MFVRAAFAAAVVAFGLGAAGAFRAAGRPVPAVAGDSPKPYGLGKPPFAQTSSASCAASGCHGGGQVGKVGSEHTTWAPTVFPDGPADPHAKAYRALFNDVSARIGQILRLTPHEDSRCLKCHAVDGVKPEPAVAEGVGCGACHGPADRWLAAHVQPGWKGLSNRDKWDRYGFVPAENLVARSLNCVGCHVGDADKEVNHDLIAAGHPRLAFESARFHFAPGYRTHWVEKTPQPDFEVRAWVVGQAATLRAATDLLRARAERASEPKSTTPWPEFAGYACYSCHQSIGNAEVRGTLGTPHRTPGLPGWELWSSAAAGVAAESCADAYPDVPPRELRAVNDLRELMGKQRSPNPETVAALAAKAVAELDAWLVALQDADDRGGPRVSPDAPRRFAARLAGNALAGAKLRDHDWDALAANYLGCAAMYHAAGGRRAVPGWANPLGELGRGLAFPPPTNGERFDGPKGFGVEQLKSVRGAFEALVTATGGRR